MVYGVRKFSFCLYRRSYTVSAYYSFWHEQYTKCSSALLVVHSCYILFVFECVLTEHCPLILGRGQYNFDFSVYKAGKR